MRSNRSVNSDAELAGETSPGGEMPPRAASTPTLGGTCLRLFSGNPEFRIACAAGTIAASQ